MYLKPFFLVFEMLFLVLVMFEMSQVMFDRFNFMLPLSDWYLMNGLIRVFRIKMEVTSKTIQFLLSKYNSLFFCIKISLIET